MSSHVDWSDYTEKLADISAIRRNQAYMEFSQAMTLATTLDCLQEMKNRILIGLEALEKLE